MIGSRWARERRIPETRLETKSFPARAVTIALCAPDTQGPWSAHSIIHICSPSKHQLGARPSLTLCHYCWLWHNREKGFLWSATCAPWSFFNTLALHTFKQEEILIKSKDSWVINLKSWKSLISIMGWTKVCVCMYVFRILIYYKICPVASPYKKILKVYVISKNPFRTAFKVQTPNLS